MPTVNKMSSVFSKNYSDFVCILVKSPFELDNKDDIVNQTFLGHKIIDGRHFKVCCVERKYKPKIENGEILKLWCKPFKKRNRVT